MIHPKPNERTFQGILLEVINSIIKSDSNIHFNRILQEENIGVGQSRFPDGLLYSSVDKGKIVLFELKNSNWDATDEILVNDAINKAYDAGISYFVTGTPRQLVIWKTFIPGTIIRDRKLKTYSISNVKVDEGVLLSSYINTISPVLINFLKDLSNLVHDIKEISWDSIDRYFVHKLSSYILEGSASMSDKMYKKINTDPALKNKIKEYLKNQDIFNVSLAFEIEDVYHICQLANYLLYLKIIFYTCLQQQAKELQLKTLSIPKDAELLVKYLKSKYKDVLKFDYEMIFKDSVLDEFLFEKDYLPVLQRNVTEIQKLNFEELNSDIIGSIYNTLIDNQEQHDRGQHFTNTDEVDLICGFCVNNSTTLILDSGCGAGTFLVRAYLFLLYHNKELSHEELLESLWGVDIAPFPSFLSTMNLSLQNISVQNNYPAIINEDFSNVKTGKYFELIFKNVTKKFETKELKNNKVKVRFPVFDSCIGNPPYIRQELIIGKEKWQNLSKLNNGSITIDRHSDFYVYYLMHTASQLKVGGMLGYVISASWLDVSFGRDLQKYLLNNFKIHAIINNQISRSFETASINTVILLLEKCNSDKPKEWRKNHEVKFVKIFKEYHELIGKSDDKNRIDKVINFINTVKNTKEIVTNDKYSINPVNQEYLLEQSTENSQYLNGHWGAKYFRAPDIYNKMVKIADEKLIKVKSMIDVHYGIKSGANDFFYVEDETNKIKIMSGKTFKLQFGQSKDSNNINWRKTGYFKSNLDKSHHLLEKKYFKPLFKSSREATGLSIDKKTLKQKVLICDKSKLQLKKSNEKLFNYVKLGESRKHELHKGETCKSRISKLTKRDWFNLGKNYIVGDFIFPAKIGEKFRVIDNRQAKVYCDKVNYNINIKNDFEQYSDLIFALLNSTFFRFEIDLFSRQLTGSQTVSDVDVNVVEDALILNPEYLIPFNKEIKEVVDEISSREQKSIFDELKEEDRIKLDSIIGKAIGLTKKDIEIFYNEARKYIKNRKIKSESVKTVKKKKKIDYDQSLNFIKERFDNINKYIELIDGKKCTDITIPPIEGIIENADNIGEENIFNEYGIIFKDDDIDIKIELNDSQQLKLFDYLYNTIGLVQFIVDVGKNYVLKIPSEVDDCEAMYKIIKKDFELYSIPIQETLKGIRSQSNYMNIYRDVFFEITQFEEKESK